MTTPALLAVPNVSEGRDPEAIELIAAAYATGGVRVLDVHSDPDHNRSVYTLTGPPGELAGAIVAGAAEILARVDVRRHDGVHPLIGALDVAPIVFLEDADAGAASAEALVLADRLGDELGIPVFLYGALAGGRTRAEIRRGGPGALATRLADGELRPDFGPGALHPTAGATLVAARPPLVAFNVELVSGATVEDARRVAAAIREGGSDGIRALRAIGVWLEHRAAAQVSMNIEDPRGTPLVDVVAAIARHADIAAAELVGLAPRAALEGFPAQIPLRGANTIEDALTPSD